jgi:hypothetical protein
MLLISSTIFVMCVVLASSLVTRRLRSSRIRVATGVGAPRWRALGLAAALLVVATPGGAWARSAALAPAQTETSAPLGRPGAMEEAPARTVPVGGSSQQSPDYAAREERARGLETFEGGSTTVVIGGSALVLILVVVIILVLL